MDRLGAEKRSWNMSRIRSKNTAPEIRLRKYLYSRGMRYRIHAKLPGKPDIVISKRTAIFVNGCFWHSHANCKRSALPKERHEWWKRKIENNQLRDSKNYDLLKNLGWKVLIVWQCEISKTKIDNTIENLVKRITN